MIRIRKGLLVNLYMLLGLYTVVIIVMAPTIWARAVNVGCFAWWAYRALDAFLMETEARG